MRVREYPKIARAFIMNKSAQSGGVAYRFRALFAILHFSKEGLSHDAFTKHR